MAMNGNGLGDEMLAAIDALSDSDKANRQALFRAMGNSIVKHITKNGVIAKGIAVQVSVSSGTGATTAPGTIS